MDRLLDGYISEEDDDYVPSDSETPSTRRTSSSSTCTTTTADGAIKKKYKRKDSRQPFAARRPKKKKKRSSRVGAAVLSDSDDDLDMMQTTAMLMAQAARQEDADGGAAAAAARMEEQLEETGTSAVADALWAELNGGADATVAAAGTDARSVAVDPIEDRFASLQSSSSAEAPTAAQDPIEDRFASLKAPADPIEDRFASLKADPIEDRFASLKSAPTDTSAASTAVDPHMVELVERVRFAGKEVDVVRRVVRGSEEAKRLREKAQLLGLSVTKPSASSTTASAAAAAASSAEPKGVVPRRKSNLSALIKTVKSKNEINTVQKSRLDWEHSKAVEGDAEDLEQYRKDGYISRVQFLRQADAREYEHQRKARRGVRKG